MAYDMFSEQLDKLIPSDWAITAFKEMVMRRWSNEHSECQDDRRKPGADIEAREDRKNDLFDRWMDGRIKDDVTYETQNERLIMRKDELELARVDVKLEELNKEQVVDEAICFIAHAGDIWLQAKDEHKIRLQKLVYEVGISVNSDQSFGTIG